MKTTTLVLFTLLFSALITLGHASLEENTMYQNVLFESEMYSGSSLYDDETLEDIYKVTSPDMLRNKHDQYGLEAMKEAVFGHEVSDDEFFEDQFLIFISFTQGSGSIKYEVGGMKDDGDYLSIQIKEYVPSTVLTADVAYHYMVFSADKAYADRNLQYCFANETSDIT